ncbi:MAG: hypothetical protein NC417_04770 [Candidatus Gastranaerophilales bacterium]|nr:hypothetical protein [Candidatus Gastranaerophilales bacterium]
MPANQDTILIFQKPELYFFPHYQDIVFSPFGIPEKSFRYLIYKLLYVLHLPCCSIFWGDWKKHLKDAKQVIIFDYGYQAGMETYIKKRYPSCQVSLFFWNIITKRQKNHKLFTDKNAIYSTDKGCCQTYHFKYNHIFYTKDYYQPYSPEFQNHLFFMGVDKGRALFLRSLKDILEKSGLVCDIRVITKVKDRAYKNALNGILTDHSLSYPDYCENIRRCGVLLDVNQEGQTALTMRVLESIYFSKKLITNNEDIVHYNFYHENNIFVLPKELSQISTTEIRSFLEKPFLPYSEEILDYYDFEQWKNRF